MIYKYGTFVTCFVLPCFQNQIALPGTNSEQITGSKPFLFLRCEQILSYHSEIKGIPFFGLN